MTPAESSKVPPKLQVVYRESVVSLLDVLGFRRLVQDAGQDASTVYRVLSALRRGARPRQVDTTMLRMEFTAFSDNVVRSTPLDLLPSPEATTDVLLLELAHLADAQKKLLRYRILVQGGVTIGGVYHDRRRGMVFGPALNRAYELMKEKAHHASIVVDPDALAFCRGPGRHHSDQRVTRLRESLHDDSGVMSVDYLQDEGGIVGPGWPNWRAYMRTLCDHKETILRYWSSARSCERELDRCRWLAGYHNYFCCAYASQLRGGCSEVKRYVKKLQMLRVTLPQTEGNPA